jgi:hypothetical protein
MSSPDQNTVLVDARGRPYFLWDVDLNLEELEHRLSDPDPVVSGYFHAKLMREAKPEDVFKLTTRARIEALWPYLDKHLGRKREQWRWLFEQWEKSDDGRE